MYHNSGGSAVKSQMAFKTEPEVKEMKYEYKSELEKLGEFSLRKFKNGVSAAKEEIYATLERIPDKKGVLYLFIRNNSTKILVYQGILMKNISNPQPFMGKEDNIRVEVLKQNRKEGDDAKGAKLVKELAKLQFVSGEECTRFVKAVQAGF